MKEKVLTFAKDNKNALLIGASIGIITHLILEKLYNAIIVLI